VKAVHAEGEGAQKLLAQDLGDADAQYSLTCGGAQCSPRLGRLERRDFHDGNACPVRLGPWATTGGAAKSVVVEREDQPWLPSLALH
jgi:hypothetical protein